MGMIAFKKPWKVNARHKYNGYRANAGRSGRQITLSFKAFIFYSIQPCFFCGDEPTHAHVMPTNSNVSAKRKAEYAANPFYCNGLDRLRNEEGYNWDNVVACCWRCNRWKHTLTKEDFLSHVKKIHDHNHL